MTVTYKEGCECCSVSSSSISSVSSSSISSVSSSSSESQSSLSSSSSSLSSSIASHLCDCGHCVWFKTITATTWTQGDGDEDTDGDHCTYTSQNDCDCATPPPNGVPGNNCDGYKSDTYGSDTIRCYKCCDVNPDDCGCACCIEADITGRLMDESSAASTCDLGNSATFTLSYGSGAEPSTGVAAGESVGSWWRGSVTYCGETTKVVVYCLENQGGCDNFYAYIEYDLPDCFLALTNGNETSHIRSGTAVACTCSPLSVAIGAFAGVGDNDSGCCCEGCDPLDASDCNFSFRLELTN